MKIKAYRSWCVAVDVCGSELGAVASDEVPGLQAQVGQQTQPGAPAAARRRHRVVAARQDV